MLLDIPHAQVKRNKGTFDTTHRLLIQKALMIQSQPGVKSKRMKAK